MVFSEIFPDYRKCDESTYLLLFSARVRYLIGNVYKWVPNKVGAYTWGLVTCGACAAKLANDVGNYVSHKCHHL